MLLLCVAATAPVGEASAQSYDPFDERTLNAVGGDGQEIPVAPSGQIVQLSEAFDSSGYTTQSGEAGNTGNQTGCARGPNSVAWGGRTSWVRFVSRVDGVAFVRAETPTYDSVLWIREGPFLPRGASTFADLVNRDCIDAVSGAGGEQIPSFRVTPNRVMHVQVAGLCAVAPPPASSGCPNPDTAPGGPTRVRVVFSPDNRDGDSVPDTLDSCKDEQGPPENAGCASPAGPPDRDRDGIADADDDCPDQGGPGRPRPRNGCPDGGGAAPGPWPCLRQRMTEEGVTINDRAIGTNTTSVTLGLFWPQGTTHILVSNDGGGPFERFGLQSCIPWKLRSAGRERDTRVVYVRFRGPSVNDEAQDDIVLDETRPRVRAASVERAPARRNRFRIKVRARDTGSGVSRLEVLDRRRRRIERIGVCAKSRKVCPKSLRTTKALRTTRAPRFVRAIDAAGNRSRVMRMRSTSCPPGYKRRIRNGRIRCVKVRR